MTKKILLFDFDETLASLTDLHRLAWNYTLEDIGINESLSVLLPPERFLMERFDSAQRITRHFFQHKNNRLILESFFQSSDHTYIVNQLLDIKESHMLYLINKLSYSEAVYRLAPNFLPICDILTRNYNYGIVSSTRQSIIYSFLDKVNLVDAFKFVIGEESLWRNNQLLDKPSAQALSLITEQVPKSVICAYIGDNVRIDALFAKNIESAFIQASAQDDFMSLLPVIEEVT